MKRLTIDTIYSYIDQYEEEGYITFEEFYYYELGNFIKLTRILRMLLYLNRDYISVQTFNRKK